MKGSCACVTWGAPAQFTSAPVTGKSAPPKERPPAGKTGLEVDSGLWHDLSVARSRSDDSMWSENSRGFKTESEQTSNPEHDQERSGERDGFDGWESCNSHRDRRGSAARRSHRGVHRRIVGRRWPLDPRSPSSPIKRLEAHNAAKHCHAARFNNNICCDHYPAHARRCLLRRRVSVARG